MRFSSIRLQVFVLFLATALFNAGPLPAEETAQVFELPEHRGAVDMDGADLPWLGRALGTVGLPNLSGAADDESTYDKAWRMQDSPNGGTRLTYGERYRRNPDGSYGAQSSSRWNSGNVGDRLLEQALSAGSGWFSSWAEGWLGGYGKARVSFRVNDTGDVTGAGDFLLPIYDRGRSTFFTQFGLRTMSGDRVIGNFGLGQRFFLADNFALGYNAFIDQDFSRKHTRGGAGVEAWYDWLRLSANYYTPLSAWKDSKDYDARYIEERPAEGYDARLTGYLPFYRNLAVTGAFEQWKGDHVGAFGRDDFVHKDPKVWSYGLEWTPVPALAASVNQRHSGSQKETQFGLTFNYNFGMDWEDQFTPAVVTEMRTVDGSRHDFVNRQNEMVLAYRAKEGVYDIRLLRALGANVFVFSLTNGFGEAVAGQRVTVALPAGIVDSGAGLYTTDADGLIQVRLITVPHNAVLPVMATLTAGKTSRTFALGATSTFTGLVLNSPAFDRLHFVSGTDLFSTATVTAEAWLNGVQQIINSGDITWEIVSSSITEVWWKQAADDANGLAWGTTAEAYTDTAGPRPLNYLHTGGGSASRPMGDTAELTDIIGNRTVLLQATWNGHTQNVTINFGSGPLSVFSSLPTNITYEFGDDINMASSNSFPAADECSGTVDKTGFYNSSNWTETDTQWYYAKGSLLPKAAELTAVSGFHPSLNPNGKGSALAAGWTNTYYVAGDVYVIGDMFKRMQLGNGNYDPMSTVLNKTGLTVCRRPL